MDKTLEEKFIREDPECDIVEGRYRPEITREEEYNSMFSFENVLRTMDNINEAQYNIRPYGTKR